MSISDGINKFIGSWKFIIIQSVIVVIWVGFNLIHVYHAFDPYPFILLNLFFSTEAAYATPLILMSAIKQAEKDSAIITKDSHMLDKLSTDMQQVNDNLTDIKHLLKEIVASNRPATAPTGQTNPSP